MLNLDTIEKEHLQLLGGMYTHGGFLFGEDLMKKRKKFHKWVRKHYSHEIQDFPEAVQAYFSPDADDGELITFLAACEEHCSQEFEHRLDPLLPLGEEVVSAVDSILSDEYWPRAVEKDGRCALLVEDGEAYRRSLILQNAEGFYKMPDGGYLIDTPKIERMLDKYRIMAELDEESEQLSVSFSGAKVEVESFNCVDSMVFWDDPWEYLEQLSGQIIFKAELPGNHCNQQEMELLPLLREVHYVCGAIEENPQLLLLKQMAQRYGYSKLEPLLTKAEAGWKDFRSSLFRRLKAALRQKKYEPLWREIFEKICQSQKEYTKKTEVCCDGNTLQNQRQRVQKFMESQGYTGTYPDFEKRFDIPGVRLMDVYGQSYTVFREKGAVSMIHCMETCESGEPTIHFLVGTAFLRKNEEVGDIYSCLFDAKGRRMFRMVRDYSLMYELEREPDQLELLAGIAVKKSQLKKLTKEEKALHYYSHLEESGWTTFWMISLFGGGFFGVFMTLGMMLVSAVMLTIFGEFHEIPSFFATVPWWQILAFCWVGFGVSMGIVTILGRRK